MSLTTFVLFVQNAIRNDTRPGADTSSVPIPTKTPRVLHPALKRLSELCDLVAFADVVGRKTKYGEKSGPSDWHFTTAFFREYGLCTPDEAIALFKEAGADNDIEAMFHVVNSQHLIP